MRPVRRADNLTTFMCRLSTNLGASTSWTPQGLSRPVMGLLYLTFIQCSEVAPGTVLRHFIYITSILFSPAQPKFHFHNVNCGVILVSSHFSPKIFVHYFV
jgi:hypothetical protein